MAVPFRTFIPSPQCASLLQCGRPTALSSHPYWGVACFMRSSSRLRRWQRSRASEADVLLLRTCSRCAGDLFPDPAYEAGTRFVCLQGGANSRVTRPPTRTSGSRRHPQGGP